MKKRLVKLPKKLQVAWEQHQEALQQYTTASEQLCALGEILTSSERVSLARRAYQLVLEISPDHYAALTGLGWLAAQKDAWQEAIGYYKSALKIKSNYAPALNLLGLAYQALNDTKSAIGLYKKAVACDPGYADALNNLATVYCEEGNLKKAIQYYQQATEYDPDFIDAWKSMGTAYLDAGQVDSAISCFEKVISMDPKNAVTHAKLGLAYFLKYDFVRGWEKYNWRWRWPAYVEAEKRDFPQPYWNGKSVGNKKLLVWGEAGLGDEILFASMIPDLQQRNIPCVLECEARLVPLFSRSFPGVKVVARHDPPHPATRNKNIAAQTAIANLGYWFRRDVNDFPGSSYLSADETLVKKLRERYVTNGKLLVGISWRTGSTILADNKTITLNDWSGILSQPGCRFVSLQYGDCADDISYAKKKFKADIIHDREVDPLHDMDLFAAQVKAMDLVITVLNTTVHTAGALGVPTWVLTPDGAAATWYWFLDREDTLWYKSVRLIRQKRIGQWQDVTKRIEHELQLYLNR